MSTFLMLRIIVLTLASPSPEPRAPTSAELARYAWLASDMRIRTLEVAFPPPPGFTRVPAAAQSFAAFLRGLPLRAAGTPVTAYDGRLVAPADWSGLAAVAELDVGKKDLQQCADSILRLHAEWLWSAGRADEIQYHFTSGHLAKWTKFAAGDRAQVKGSKVSWARTAKASSTRATFRAYLDLVFTYGGTRSIGKHGRAVARDDIQPGDYFVTPGSPGHAVLVLDVAVDGQGRKAALLGQGYMPAQDFHVLADRGEPWFLLSDEPVATPSWAPFDWNTLERF